MWRDYFENALSDPKLTQFEQVVLSDYSVSDAEYREAQGLFKQCMEEQGWIVEIIDNQYHVSGGPLIGNDWATEKSDKDKQACQKGTLWYVEPLYHGMKDNPEGLTKAQLVRDCFEENDVPDGLDLTEDEFSTMLDDPSYVPSSPTASLCRLDPTGSTGLTEEDAVMYDQQKG